jgi:hypothetical protein
LRDWLLTLAVCACGKDAPAPSRAPDESAPTPRFTDAAASPAARREPWFPLAGAPRDPEHPVLVWARGERSFVVILPPAAPAPGAPGR